MAGDAANVPWIDRPALRLDLDLPPADRFAPLDESVLRHTRELLAAVMAEIPAGARPLADLVRLRTRNRFQAEIAAMAARADVPWRQIVLANISYDLALSMFGCSTIALATPDGPVLARNMDWWPEDVLAKCSYEIRFIAGTVDEVRFINYGWPGAVGAVTGMSARGFAIALNAVIGDEGVNRTGYPVLLHIRRVLEDARNYDEAVTMLSETKLAAPALLTIVGTRNDQRLVIERSPTKRAHREPDGDCALIATNDYRLLFRTETHPESILYQTTCARFDALMRMLGDRDASLLMHDAKLLYVLTDPAVIQSITAQHIIMQPATMHSRLCVPRRLVETQA